MVGCLFSKMNVSNFFRSFGRGKEAIYFGSWEEKDNITDVGGGLAILKLE